jgi:hypothetical protein
MELARTVLTGTTVLMTPIRKYARQIHPRLRLKRVQLQPSACSDASHAASSKLNSLSSKIK